MIGSTTIGKLDELMLAIYGPDHPDAPQEEIGWPWTDPEARVEVSDYGVLRDDDPGDPEVGPQPDLVWGIRGKAIRPGIGKALRREAEISLELPAPTAVLHTHKGVRLQWHDGSPREPLITLALGLGGVER